METVVRLLYFEEVWPVFIIIICPALKIDRLTSAKDDLLMHGEISRHWLHSRTYFLRARIRSWSSKKYLSGSDGCAYSSTWSISKLAIALKRTIYTISQRQRRRFKYSYPIAMSPAQQKRVGLNTTISASTFHYL